MILPKNRYLSPLLVAFLSFLFSYNTAIGQNGNLTHNTFVQSGSYRQDTARETRKRNMLRAEEPDTNFTFEKYEAFLRNVSDTSKYIVLPLEEFRKSENTKKIVIGLRHDLDNDLNHAFSFSDTEYKLGVRSTYYVLHTAPYYLENPNNMSVHSARIIPVLKSMQNDRHMEIGLHNDLVTLQAVYNIDPVQFLNGELSWLRSNGIKISGTASHGSPYCYTYKYLNFYFFEECTNPPVGQFVNNLTLPLGGIPVPMKKGKLADFNLSYEAYFLNNNKYFSDASITAGVRWNIGMLDISKLVPGDRVILLLHPIHWHKASVKAEIESFHINGEESTVIDHTNKIVTVRMPFGADRSNLSASYLISPGAQAKIAGVLQTSGNHPLNLTSPVTLSIYAENRKVINDWTINVYTAQSNACDFESFTVTGFTGKIKINASERRILAELNGDPDLSALKISFNLSKGAKAFIGATECFSNSVFIDFTLPVVFVVVAADGVTSSEWTVTIVQNTIGVEDPEPACREMRVYPNPTSGKVTLQFFDVTVPSLTIEIFNSLGEKAGSINVNGTGDFSVAADLSEFPSGVYFIKHSGSSSPVKVLLRKN